MHIIEIALLLVVNLVSWSLLKSTYLFSLTEIKHRSSSNDHYYLNLAKLYSSLIQTQAFLIILFGLSSLLGSYYLFKFYSYIGLGIDFILLIGYFRNLHSLKNRFVARFFIKHFSKYVEKIVLFLISPLTMLANLFKLKIEPNYKIYSKSDLRRLLNNIKKQSDVRIDSAALTSMNRVMLMDTKTIDDFIITLDNVVCLSPDDYLGPKLLDEMYRSNQLYFPVLSHSKLVGVVYIASLGMATVGKIKDYMLDKYLVIKTGASLRDLLELIYNNSEYPIIVELNSEKTVGIIRLNEIIEYLFLENSGSILKIN